MNSFTPSVYWYTTIDVDFNRAAGREVAPLTAPESSLGIDLSMPPQRFRPSAARCATCGAYG